MSPAAMVPGLPVNVYSAALISTVRLGVVAVSVAGLSAPQDTTAGNSNSDSDSDGADSDRAGNHEADGKRA